MGREAMCVCRWGERSAEVKALLETRELVLRGAIRRRISVADLRSLRVDGDTLAFEVDGEAVALELGGPMATKWQAALRKPPPTLAERLGIRAGVRVRVFGEMGDANLQEALNVGVIVRGPGDFDLAVGVVELPEDLVALVRRSAELRGRGVALWVVYAKGPKSVVGERQVREALRDAGMIDTKVASVSGRLTGLRFS
jgi:hypothetical protein